MRRISVGHREISDECPAYVIAEVAQAHDGSLGSAHAYIDVAADAGADAVKFQAHIAEAESTLDEAFRVNFSYEDKTRYDYWKRMAFAEEQWRGLAGHARERGLDFICSVFSDEAFAMIERVGVAAWKIASGEVLADGRMPRMAASGLPLLISTGMSDWAEIDRVVAHAGQAAGGFALLQCTSMYPTPLEAVGLNVMDEMRARYDVPVGLSDHSASPWPPIAALARGARILEMHIVFDRRAFGPDAKASLTPAEFAQVVEARDAFHRLATNSVDKDRVAGELAPLKGLFSHSLAPAMPLAAGTAIERRHLALKKPGTGIPAEDIAGLIGRRLARDVSPDRLLRESDFA